MDDDIEVTTEEEVTEDGEATTPETGGWWSFKSKEEFQAKADEIVEKRLARERRKFDPIVQEHATLKSEVEELRPLRDASLTDSQRWEAEKAAIQSELEELRSFKTTADRDNLIREIAQDKGLPEKLTRWVSGNDMDSITQSVEELLNDLSEVGQSKKPTTQRKPVELDADKPGSKGYSGGGSDGDEAGALEARILENFRANRNSFSLD